MNDRMPPANIDAEEAVLGSVLIDPACIVRVMKHVKPEDFFIVKNRLVFESMLRLRSFARPIDFVTVVSTLDDSNHLEEIGGAAFISHLVNSTPTSIHAEGYADMVRSASVSRSLIAAASSIAQIAYDSELNAEQKTAQALSELKARRDTRGGEARSIGVIAADIVTQLEQWSDQPLGVDEVRGLSSGFPSIDKLTGGFVQQEQTVLAGRTGTGKSALAFQIGANVAQAGHKVAIFSLEMAERMIGYRLISGEVCVPYQDMLRGWMKGDSWERMYKALARLDSLPLYINDKSSQSIASIESNIASLEDIDLFIVDHLRLIKDVRKNENEVSRLGRLSMELRQIARDYNTHCLLITQLNRGLETRDDKRPTLADIRQSGEIEENADNVWGIYRAHDDKSILCVSPLKNRNGEAGIDIVSELKFDARYMRFERATRYDLNDRPA